MITKIKEIVSENILAITLSISVSCIIFIVGQDLIDEGTILLPQYWPLRPFFTGIVGVLLGGMIILSLIVTLRICRGSVGFILQKLNSTGDDKRT